LKAESLKFLLTFGEICDMVFSLCGGENKAQLKLNLFQMLKALCTARAIR